MKPLVAASCGPAGDNVATWSGATDPSTAVHTLPDAVVARYYRRKIAALAAAEPDLVALETLPSLREARLAIGALASEAPQLPAWVSFICLDDATTSGGDDIGEVGGSVSVSQEEGA